MPRQIDTATLTQAVKDYKGHLFAPTIWSPNGSRVARGGRDWVLQSLRDADFDDEHEFLIDRLREELGASDRADLDAIIATWPARDPDVHAKKLADKLAIDLAGRHLLGCKGCVDLGRVRMGTKVVEVEVRESRRYRRMLREQGYPDVRPIMEHRVVSDWWPVYAGEAEERERIREGKREWDADKSNRHAIDPFPHGVGAEVTNIAAETAVIAVNGVVDDLDVGDAAANIRGRTGAQPADPDAAETGTLLFTLVCSDPAFGAAADDAAGSATATASAITDDASADATGTLGYVRAAAMGVGADDIIDGNTTTDGTGATDWNTLSIVSGSTVSMSSWTVTLSQGSTAT